MAFFSMQMLGGWLDQALVDQRWIIIGSKGPVRAVTGIRDVHVVPQEGRSHVFSRDGLFLDVRANPAKSAAPIGRFGNEGVGVLQGPGLFNTSLGLSKSFTILERLQVKLSGSFTNVFNHTNYSDPNMNLGSSSFGTITSATATEFGGARTGQVGVRIQF